MVKRAADRKSLSLKLWELHEQWEPHDPETLPKRLPVKKINLRPDVYQARGTSRNPAYGDINPAKVDEMRELLNGNPTMDMKPVLVLHLPKAKPSKRFVLLDGHHRHMAYVGVSREDIPVEYVTVNPTQALQAANDENSHIREPLTPEGKTQHAWRLLREELVDHQTGKRVTLQWIAKTAGVSLGQAKFASAKLKEIRESGGVSPESWFDAIGWGRDDEAMRDKQVERYAKELRKHFRMDKIGFPELFAKALCAAWPERIFEIFDHLLEQDNMRDKLEEYIEYMEEEGPEPEEKTSEEEPEF